MPFCKMHTGNTPMPLFLQNKAANPIDVLNYEKR